MDHPAIIQGGMGAAVSDWRLARAVSQRGQLGVVSATGMDSVLVRRLQQGDEGGHMRRALSHFPHEEISARIIERYFIEGGKAADVPFKHAPMFKANAPLALQQLTVAANFVEVFLAKEGHDGLVGINLMEKIQMPTLPSLYGAMLAGVDYVLMGAGIPREIPGALDALSNHERVSLKLYVVNEAPTDDFRTWFDPRAVLPLAIPPLKRPQFLAIIASATLAVTLARKSNGRVDGFVIEGPTAGGHNAPPRGALQLNARGEPLYGPRDEVDLGKIRDLGLPYWLAGSYAEPEKLRAAWAEGATGIQVGTAFAFCEESGLESEVKRALLEAAVEGSADLITDPSASPTGFPFKVANLDGSLSDPEFYMDRSRVCDLGYLRTIVKRDDGKLDYRCPAEPVDAYVKKGGNVEETEGRKCLCNGLTANIGLSQRRADGYQELPLVTTGDDYRTISRFLKGGKRTYRAGDVLDYLLDVAKDEAGVAH